VDPIAADQQVAPRLGPIGEAGDHPARFGDADLHETLAVLEPDAARHGRLAQDAIQLAPPEEDRGLRKPSEPFASMIEELDTPGRRAPGGDPVRDAERLQDRKAVGGEIEECAGLVGGAGPALVDRGGEAGPLEEHRQHGAGNAAAHHERRAVARGPVRHGGVC
jgi:hypothetical protein